MARRSLGLAALAAGWVMTVKGQTAAPIHDGPATGAASRLGPGDVIQIRAVEAEDISDKPIRIASDGYINLPSVGRLKVSDRTAEEVQTEIEGRLKRLIVNPVSVELLRRSVAVEVDRSSVRPIVRRSFPQLEARPA